MQPSSAALFNIVSWHAIFESNALLCTGLYWNIHPCIFHHFVRHFLVFFLHYPRFKSMSVTLWAHRDISLKRGGFLFSVFSSYFSFSALIDSVGGSGFRGEAVEQTNRPRLCSTHPLCYMAKRTSPHKSCRNEYLIQLTHTVHTLTHSFLLMCPFLVSVCSLHFVEETINWAAFSP